MYPVNLEEDRIPVDLCLIIIVKKVVLWQPTFRFGDAFVDIKRPIVKFVVSSVSVRIVIRVEERYFLEIDSAVKAGQIGNVP